MENMEKNVMSVFGFGIEDVEEAMDKVKQEKERARDGRICACGHSMRHHDVASTGEVTCSPGRQLCKCEQWKPVIKVADTRYFMRKSEGNGQLHALTLGIVASFKAKPELADKMEWLVPSTCERCKNEEVQLFPTHVSEAGVIVDHSAPFSALLCEDCRFG
jgi:hypothetical protein